MSEAPHWINLADVVLDERIYPRVSHNQHHVTEFAAAMKVGSVLPPITVEEGTNRVVDGWHRVMAARANGEERISAIVRRYASEADLVADSVSANTAHGLRLDSQDQVKCAELGIRYGIPETTLAAALRTSLQHLRAISTRFATVAEAQAAMPELRHVEPVQISTSELRKVAPSSQPVTRVPLKASVRHLSGTTITEAQRKAIESAPGQSYLLSVRQVIQALEHDLLPPVDQHPALWRELAHLRDLLDDLDIEVPTA